MCTTLGSLTQPRHHQPTLAQRTTLYVALAHSDGKMKANSSKFTGKIQAIFGKITRLMLLIFHINTSTQLLPRLERNDTARLHRNFFACFWVTPRT
ncbi:Uncharacterised protein [Moraxella caviae]|uniref:Uncharacterized protein n=1 Tax=Moraxella caviae TaxID=34060 RepID=A0A378R3H1_9GAMM|nr:Uncharacterised protein [Moraxella caviae]VEW11217.1 Uncharacterised protein [Moraxella caviae]